VLHWQAGLDQPSIKSGFFKICRDYEPDFCDFRENSRLPLVGRYS
jgi:hypothetical protein